MEQISQFQPERTLVLICQCRRQEWAPTLSERLVGPRVILRGSGDVYEGDCAECLAHYAITISGERAISLADRADALAASEIISA